MARRELPMARGGGQNLPPREKAPHGEGLPTRRTSEGICPRENALLGEGLPTRRTSKRICPAQERSPRRRHPDTAHGRRDLPRAETLPSAKASRHGARAKGFAPRRNAPHGEGLPTRRTSERVCPRRNALLGEGLPKRRTGERICPAQKRSHGEGLPTRRTSERICPAQKRSPRRKPPDTAHERKDLPRAGMLPSAKASRHGARAKRFAPRGSRSAHVLTNGGPPSVDGQPEKHPFGGVAPETARPLPSSFTLKKRLLHEIQLFYGESHVGSRQIFLSFPSVGRCVARERNPMPPFAPHRGRGHRGLRRTGEVCHGFGKMVRRFGECPRGGKSLPRGGNEWPLGGGRYGPELRCFGERFHQRRRANPDACRAPRCSHG